MLRDMALDLPERALVVVDSAALVYLAEGDSASPRRAVVEFFLRRAAAGELRLAASTVAWAELLELPLARRDPGLATRYRMLLSDSRRIALREVDVVVAEEAASVAASLGPSRRRSLSSNDIFHIATAIVLGADAVLTNDEDWVAVPRCPPVILVDELAAELEPY